MEQRTILNSQRSVNSNLDSQYEKGPSEFIKKMRKKYFKPEIERQLWAFKAEIEKKFANSKVNIYQFPKREQSPPVGTT